MSKVERNALIADRVEAGETYASIGRDLEISTSRVAALYRREAARRKLVPSFDLDTPIDQLPLEARLRNCLLNAGHTSLRGVTAAPLWHLLRTPNFGHKSLSLLEEALNQAKRVSNGDAA